jgi:hypothetical protein
MTINIKCELKACAYNFYPSKLFICFKVHDPAENDTLVVRPVLGYAPAGTFEGEIVFVNFGRVEDFEKLKNELNVSVDGKIAIMKYGKIFRGDKVKM